MGSNWQSVEFTMMDPNNKLASSLDETVISKIWNYHSLTHWLTGVGVGRFYESEEFDVYLGSSGLRDLLTVGAASKNSGLMGVFILFFLLLFVCQVLYMGNLFWNLFVNLMLFSQLNQNLNSEVLSQDLSKEKVFKLSWESILPKRMQSKCNEWRIFLF